MSPPCTRIIAEAAKSARRRAEWNLRFGAWEKPPTDAEDTRLTRAEDKVKAALAKNDWLRGEGIQVRGQGSYYNNTNVRLEGDVDLRVVHPTTQLRYASGVDPALARAVLGIGAKPFNPASFFAMMRDNLGAALRAGFGASAVTAGTKAFNVSGIVQGTTSIDIVPVINDRYIYQAGIGYASITGVTFLTTGGTCIANYPEQHYANGVDKRSRTSRRFKKMVRIFKKLRGEMPTGFLAPVRPTSFLVECLVYLVEDTHFCVESDDAYDRVRRIASRMREILETPGAPQLREINGCKYLFGPSQPWTLDQAKAFVAWVLRHLGDA